MDKSIKKSKLGSIYTYYNETIMLKVAHDLEAEGYRVKRYQSKDPIGQTIFYCKIIGYKEV
ncbi:MAG: hypothetical protein IJT36_03240 [Alphaproteobacteria bacterium]|nr:hypothetical protein [Alphaproteobacteria bacterium]